MSFGGIEDIVVDDMPEEAITTETLDEAESVESDSDSLDLMDEGDNNNVLREPTRKVHESSALWEEAGSKIIENGEVIGSKCNFCPKTYKKNSGNTTNLMNHVITKHKKDHPGVVNKLQNKIKEKKEKQKQKRIKKDKKSSTQPKILNWVPRKGVIDSVKQKKLKIAIQEYIVATNKPFSEVENHFFRQMLFVAEPNFVCPSRRTITTECDKSAQEARKALKKEISEDVETHKTINITSDHGTSADKFRTKKNAVTAAWCTNNFVIKKATLDLYKCDGSQSGFQIRSDVKNSLEQLAGWKEDWRVNWVTDGEKKQLNARDPTKHKEIGFPTFKTGTCVDHTFELVCEETIDEIPAMKGALKTLRELINYLKDSALAREALFKIQLQRGGIDEALTMLQGTINRWFHKYNETRRALLLRELIEQWYADYDVPSSVSILDDEDWKLLLIYENALAPVVEAAKLLEGELYPTASSVIPFLDQIAADLGDLGSKLTGDGRDFVVRLLKNLQTSKRFANLYKDREPYNILTSLDTRYGNLYINNTELSNKVLTALENDVIFKEERILDEARGTAEGQPEETVPAAPPADLPSSENKLLKRRAQLMAAKAHQTNQASTSTDSTNVQPSFQERLKEELDRILKLGGSLDLGENPNNWWRINEKQFPLLAKFWMANCPFPATSASSERVFNMDSLVIDPHRKSLTEDRSKNLVIHRDYLLSKSNRTAYNICPKCPSPPDVNASYKLCCNIHR